jgi:uncharacterized protein (TIGR04255 family)
MARLTVDDFKPSSLTCELRYQNAYLIYDRTGQVLQSLRGTFADVIVSAASPPQTAFVAKEGWFTLEVGACRFTSAHFERNSEAFARYCKAFFDVVADQLEISVFTRIGLRYIARREFGTLDESRATLASMGLVGLKPAKRFNSSESPTEVVFRWEDAQVGAILRLRAETVEIKFAAPADLQDHVPPVDKQIPGLTLDIDYYTVAPVERVQWNALEWLQTKLRIIRKEADGVLRSGR